MITDLSQLDPKKKYTYQDYLTWDLKERVELIAGKIFRMTPAPSADHQSISSQLHGLLWSYLKDKPCKIFSAPLDVRFFTIDKEGNQIIEDTVQPDLVVICDMNKIDRRGCIGAPDLIVEILSPSTSEKDLTWKYELYQRNGVKEYWVVHPEEKTLLIHTLIDGQYVPGKLLVRSEQARSNVFPDLIIDLSEVFEPFDWDKVLEEEKKYNRI